MGIFSRYPYTDFNNLNLDWILQRMREVEAELQRYLDNAVITFADPITWDITAQYTALTVVVDSDGTAYLSKQPVPTGISIDNTDYWLPIFNYDDNINGLRDQIAFNARTSATTPQALTAGSLVFWNGVIYKVTTDMPAGTAFIVGANIEQYTVDRKIDDIVTNVDNIANDLAAETQDRIDADNDLQNQINALNQSVRYVTPYDFGAAGDGLTDDTVACQAAIEEAQRTGAILLIPDATFLVSTLWVSANIYIMGSGTLKGFPLRYDFNTAPISAGSNEIIVSDGKLYNRNMILTVTDYGHTDVMVVTDISGNTLTVKRARYYDGMEHDDTFKYSYATGTDIHINTVPLVITKHIYTVDVETDANVYQIDNVTMTGVSVLGAHSGYDSAKDSIYDIIYNGCVYTHIVKNVTIENGEFGNCYNNCIGFNGRCEGITVRNNKIHDISVPSNITDVGLRDTAGGILAHWDQRTQDSADVTTNFVIEGNYINNCYCGVFLSAAKHGSVISNHISNCGHIGVMVYSGDLGFGALDTSVTGNTIYDCINADETRAIAINLFGCTRALVNGNIVLHVEIGVHATLAETLLVEGNQFIGTTYKGAFVERANGRFINNTFATSSGSEACVEINNTTATPISQLEFIGNLYDGQNNQQSAYNFLAGQNFYSFGNFCRLRFLYKAPATITDADNINTIRDYLMQPNSVTTTLIATRLTIRHIDTFYAGGNYSTTSTKYLAKPTADLSDIVTPSTGALVYDTTTQTLKVYNGSNWVNV